MPYIQSKVSVSVNKEKREQLKERLGQIISLIPGKSENWLMVELEDQCCLYFQGNQKAPTAFIEVKIFGKASGAVYHKMTEALCDLFEQELGIPKNRIYVKYEEVENWGWNGSNF